jgi:hypothetical protein
MALGSVDRKGGLPQRYFLVSDLAVKAEKNGRFSAVFRPISDGTYQNVL